MSEKGPLILVSGGTSTLGPWRIMAPRLSYGNDLEYGRGEDRRYEEICVVNGSLGDATARLLELERGRAK